MPARPSPGTTRPQLAALLLVVSLGLLPSAGLAFAVRDVPNPRRSHRGWVSDVAGLLRPDTETRINGMVAALVRHDGSELMVVTVPDTRGSSSPKTFATELFNTFKIGKKGVDNGVLMLISKGDRRVEIETGYGVEERLPDAKAGAIITTAMLPQFKQGDFDGGTLLGVAGVIGSLSPQAMNHLPGEEKPGNSVTKSPSRSNNDYTEPLIILIALVLTGIDAALKGFRIGSNSSSDSVFSSDGDSGGGGGGGDSDGGGSSGGGGAGDSW